MQQVLPQGCTSREHQVEAPVVAGEGAAIKQLAAFVAEVLTKGLAEFASVYIIQRDQHGILGFGIAILQGPGSEQFPPSLAQLHKAHPTCPPAAAHVSMDGSRAYTPTHATARTASLDSCRPSTFNMYNARSRRLFRLDDSGWTVTDAKMQGKPRLYSCRRPCSLTGLQPMEAAWLYAAGMRSMLSVPCIHDGRVCGSVLLASRGTDWEEKAAYHAVHKVAPAVHAAGIQLAAGLPVHRFVPADEIACGVLHELVHLDKILLCRIMAPGAHQQTQPKQIDVRQHGVKQVQQHQQTPGGSVGGTIGAKLHAHYAGGGLPEQTLNTIKAYYRQTPADASDATTTSAAVQSSVTQTTAMTKDTEGPCTPSSGLVAMHAGSVSLSGLVQEPVAPSPSRDPGIMTQTISQTALSEPQPCLNTSSRPCFASRPQQAAAVDVASIPAGQQLGCVNSASSGARQQIQTGSAQHTGPQASTAPHASVPAATRPCHWVSNQCVDACHDVSMTMLQSVHQSPSDNLTHMAALPGSGAVLQSVRDTHRWQVVELLDTAQQPQGHLTQPHDMHLQPATDTPVDDAADMSAASHMMLSRLQGACDYMVARGCLDDAADTTQRTARSEDLQELSKLAAVAAADSAADAPHATEAACMAHVASQPLMHVNMLDAPSRSSAMGSGVGLWSSAYASHTALFDPYGTTKDLTSAAHACAIGLRHQHHLSSTNINTLMLNSMDNSLDFGTPDGKSSPVPAVSTALRQWLSHGAASGRKQRSLPVCGPMTPLSTLSHGHTEVPHSSARLLPATAATVHSEYMGDGHGPVKGAFMMDESVSQKAGEGCMQSVQSWDRPHLDPGTREYMSGSLQYAMESLGPTLSPRAFAQAKASLASDHECVQLAATSMLFSPTSRLAAPSRSSSKPC